jgi:hypothetical protein
VYNNQAGYQQQAVQQQTVQQAIQGAVQQMVQQQTVQRDQQYFDQQQQHSKLSQDDRSFAISRQMLASQDTHTGVVQTAGRALQQAAQSEQVKGLLSPSEMAVDPTYLEWRKRLTLLNAAYFLVSTGQGSTP